MNETLQSAYELTLACGEDSVLSDELRASFDAPWQAEAFAVTVNLVKNGAMTWVDWVAEFSKHIADAPQQTNESVNDAYFRQWLSALEAIVIQKGMTQPQEVDETHEHWRRSYLNTPHGQPVEFSRGYAPPDHDHDHDHDHGHDHHHHAVAKPISVSPAIR